MQKLICHYDFCCRLEELLYKILLHQLFPFLCIRSSSIHTHGIGFHRTLFVKQSNCGTERMVRSTKRCLKKTIGRARLTFEQLLMVITEIEMIINCRPLSFVTSRDWEDPLTPSHLMNGCRLMDASIGTFSNVLDDRVMDESVVFSTVASIFV